MQCNIHIATEGQHPQCYFFGRDAEKWSTQAKWNVFDFTVSYLSLVLATVITEVPQTTVFMCVYVICIFKIRRK